MREPLTRERLHALMDALARSAPSGLSIRAYFIGGATAVDRGWRSATIDADLHATDDRLFVQVQQIKERLHVNVELARPEDFVPPLKGSRGRHLFIVTLRSVSFFHYDPYAQLLSKIVRGFGKDLADADRFLRDGLVEAERFRRLVHDIPQSAYSKYPNLSRSGVEGAVDAFLALL
jgi:hypothetical protein